MGTSKSKHQEGKLTEAIEDQTAKLPSDVYLWAAVASMTISLGCYMAGKKHASLFFGHWAPSLLIMGLYNKIVKVAGHDAEDSKSAFQ